MTTVHVGSRLCRCGHVTTGKGTVYSDATGLQLFKDITVTSKHVFPHNSLSQKDCSNASISRLRLNNVTGTFVTVIFPLCITVGFGLADLERKLFYCVYEK